MELNLFEGGVELSPLQYSTGESQLDVVENVVERFESSDQVWVEGRVGTGKSVIGLRTALELGGGSVSVPTKVLGRQYRRDYGSGGKYFERPDGETASIAVFEGRSNFECPWVVERRNEEEKVWRDTSCNNFDLPCRRSLGTEESRLVALEDCRFAGAILRNRFVPVGKSSVYDVHRYTGLDGKYSVLVKGGCPYVDQHAAFAYADIVVMNSPKMRIEVLLGRLPWKPVVVIDEADYFLDNVCKKVVLSEKGVMYIGRRLKAAVDELKKKRKETDKTGYAWAEFVDKMDEEIGKVSRIREKLSVLRDKFFGGEYEAFEGAGRFISLLMDVEAGERLVSDLYEVLEHQDVADFKDDRGDESNPRVTYFIADPAPVIKDFLDRLGAKVLFMSGTKPSRYVMREVFGIDPELVVAEPEFPGTIVQRWTGREFKVNYKKWKDVANRRRFFEARDMAVAEAKDPVFVPVHATKYAPEEIRDELTSNDGLELDGVMYSTKMDRGADLEEMKSVVVLKYPFAYLGDARLQAMKKRLGKDKFWGYYRDMARREFIQQVGRVTRSRDAVVEFWSPDYQCHEMLRRYWGGRIVVNPISN